jgi:hypothetical protein
MRGCRRHRIAAPQLDLLKAGVQTLCDNFVPTLLRIIVTRGQGAEAIAPTVPFSPQR